MQNQFGHKMKDLISNLLKIEFEWETFKITIIMTKAVLNGKKTYLTKSSAETSINTWIWESQMSLTPQTSELYIKDREFRAAILLTSVCKENVCSISRHLTEKISTLVSKPWTPQTSKNLPDKAKTGSLVQIKMLFRMLLMAKPHSKFQLPISILTYLISSTCISSRTLLSELKLLGIKLLVFNGHRWWSR